MSADAFYRALAALAARSESHQRPRNLGAVPPAFIERQARQGVEL